MSDDQKLQGVAQADQARAELYDTLAQLRDRLDYAQRIDDASARTKARLVAEQRQNPLGFAAGVAVIAVGVGLAAWAITSKVVRALER